MTVTATPPQGNVVINWRAVEQRAAQRTANTEGRFSFPVTAGLLSRGVVRDIENGVRQIGWNNGVDTKLDVLEGGGFLSRTYTFQGSYVGQRDAVEAARQTLKSWIDAM